MHRRLDDVFDNRHVRPQVKPLKHHAEAGTQALDLVNVLGHVGAGFAAFHADFLTGNVNIARRGYLEQIDTTQEGAFAGTRSAREWK